MTMERCKTCKHWDSDEDIRLLGAGQCNKAPQIWDVTDELGEEDDWRGGLRLKPENAAVLAVVEDGSAYRASLITMPDFGCVQHEQATGEVTL